MPRPSLSGPEERPLTLAVAEHPSDEELGLVVRGVRDFNRSVAGHDPPRPVGAFLRDDTGRVVGGVRGDLWGRSVHVAALWVAESHRGHGHGAALLRELEAYAAARGHLLAYVETLSYQARPFYERQGYRVFGELEGIAAGCTFYFLRKDLRAGAPALSETSPAAASYRHPSPHGSVASEPEPEHGASR